MRYAINIFSGKTFCGNAFHDTIGECMEFFEKEGAGFCDKAKILDAETGAQYTIKVKYEEVR